MPYRNVRAGNETHRKFTCICTAGQRIDDIITGGSLIGIAAGSSTAETYVCARVCLLDMKRCALSLMQSLIYGTVFF